MKKVVITGITGTLGRALGKWYRGLGWTVIGVSRQKAPRATAGMEHGEPSWDHFVVNGQKTHRDAGRLLALDADLYVLCAGAIETSVGPRGEPLLNSLEQLTCVNYLFPATLALEANWKRWTHPVEIICVGSIADGSPSAFGPLYHASKSALHHFVCGTAPILSKSNADLRVRLYRPGVIRGPLSRAPMNRLSPMGQRIRERRCAKAPDASVVAGRMVKWIERGGTVGTYAEPISFRLLKFLFALAPHQYARLQHFAWRRAGNWP